MEMDHIYGNVDLPTTAGSKRHPSFPEKDVSEHTGRTFRERDPLPSNKSLKFLLVVVSLLLLCSLVGLCVLGVLYANKSDSHESLRDQCTSAEENWSVQLRNATAAAEELKSRLDQVQVNYEKELRHVASLNETERQCEALKVKYRNISACSETEKQCEALKVKYRKAHEVFSACSESQKCGQCGEGWRRFGVKCYYFSTDKLNWMKSRDRCVEKEGHLIIITSQAEQTFVSSVEETHWIGLNDLETEGKWMWVNNQPLTETRVTFWYHREDEPDEPDNWKQEDSSGENCGCLGHINGDTHSWFDSSCSILKKYICEK